MNQPEIIWSWQDKMSLILLLGKEKVDQSNGIRGILVYPWMSSCRGWSKEGRGFSLLPITSANSRMCFLGSRVLKMGGVRGRHSIPCLSNSGALIAKERVSTHAVRLLEVLQPENMGSVKRMVRWEEGR